MKNSNDSVARQPHLSTLVLSAAAVVGLGAVAARLAQRGRARLRQKEDAKKPAARPATTATGRVERFGRRATESFESLNDQNSQILSKSCQNSGKFKFFKILQKF